VLLGNTLKEGEARREDVTGNLNSRQSSPLKENRTAEVRTNGKAGSPKQ